MPYTVKKTTQLIVESSNNYVITVKGNQPSLFQQLQALAALNLPSGRFIDVEKTRNRITCRIVSVFDDISGIDPDWEGLKSFIQVDRIGMRQGQPYQQSSYYIRLVWK